MKTAIIAVSRDGLNIAKRLLGLYPQASIYASPRLITADQRSDDREGGAKEDQASSLVYHRGEQHCSSFSPVTRGEGKSIPSAHEAHRNSLPLEQEAQKNSLPLEGGGAGWGCDVKLTLHSLEDNFKTAIADLFTQYRLLIFISALAVAVRAIAPCLQGKDKDPAVVVIDDQSRFVISLLSGHHGGANEATQKIARFLQACPVVTTATDSRGKTAFDDLARRFSWKIENLPDLKKISAALLEERKIYLLSDKPFKYPLKGNIERAESEQDLELAVNGYVLISNRLEPLSHYPPYPYILLRPTSITAGVGCRKGISVAAIIRAVENAFTKAGLSLSSLSCLATGEFKAEEEGLISAAAHFKVPLRIFTGKEIEQQIGASAISEFVKNQVGVGAVAEPCARLGSGGGPLLLEVQRGEGITVALAESLFYPAQEV